MLSAEGLGPRTLCMAASHAVACLLLPFASSPAVSFSCVTPSAPGAGYCRDMPVARALPPGGEETAGDPEHPGSHQPRCGSRCRSRRHPAEHATAHHPELSDPPPPPPPRCRTPTPLLRARATVEDTREVPPTRHPGTQGPKETPRAAQPAGCCPSLGWDWGGDDPAPTPALETKPRSELLLPPLDSGRKTPPLRRSCPPGPQAGPPEARAAPSERFTSRGLGRRAGAPR